MLILSEEICQNLLIFVESLITNQSHRKQQSLHPWIRIFVMLFPFLKILFHEFTAKVHEARGEWLITVKRRVLCVVCFNDQSYVSCYNIIIQRRLFCNLETTPECQLHWMTQTRLYIFAAQSRSNNNRQSRPRKATETPALRTRSGMIQDTPCKFLAVILTVLQAYVKCESNEQTRCTIFSWSY